MTEPSRTPLTFTARDGYGLAGRLTRASGPARGALLLTAGTGFPMGFYQRAADHFARRGAVVLTYDMRGIGGSRPDDLARFDMDYTDWGRLDMPAALDALIAEAPDLPVAHVGHSVGGHFAGFMDNHGLIERHAFVAVGSGYWRKHPLSYNPVELFFWWGYGPYSLARHGYIKSGAIWRGADLPRGVFLPWRRWCHDPAYFGERLWSELKPNHFAEVTAPIRSWIFSDDPIANRRTAPDMMAAYPRAPSDLIVHQPRDFGRTAVGHDGMFRKGMEAFWDEVLDWALPA